MNLEEISQNKYMYLKKFKKHKMYLNHETNETVLLKEYNTKVLDALNRIKKISTTCNIPEIEMILYSEDKIYSVEQYIQGRPLDEYISFNQMNEVEIISLLKQLIHILEIMNKDNVLHKDIKPANIIISKKSSGRKLKVYLIDFNISRVYSIEKEKDTELFGTKGYASPEHFGCEQTSFKSDIYSLGKTIEILTSKYSIKNLELKNLISKMTNFDPSNRPTYLEIKKELKTIEQQDTCNETLTKEESNNFQRTKAKETRDNIDDNSLAKKILGSSFIPFFYWNISLEKQLIGNGLLFSFNIYIAIAFLISLTEDLPQKQDYNYYLLLICAYIYIVIFKYIFKEVKESSMYMKLIKLIDSIKGIPEISGTSTSRKILQQLSKVPRQVVIITIKFTVKFFILTTEFSVSLIGAGLIYSLILGL